MKKRKPQGVHLLAVLISGMFGIARTQQCFSEGTSNFPLIMADSYSTTETSTKVGSVVNMRSCTDSAGVTFTAVLHNQDYTASTADNRLMLAIFDATYGRGRLGHRSTIQTYDGSWDSSRGQTALFFDADCTAVAFGFYAENGQYRFLRYELPMGCSTDTDPSCYSTLALEPYLARSYADLDFIPSEAFQFETSQNNMFLVRTDDSQNSQTYPFEPVAKSGIQGIPALNANLDYKAGESKKTYLEATKTYTIYSSVMFSATELIFAGASYDYAVFGGYDLTSNSGVRNLLFENKVWIGIPIDSYGLTKPMLLRKHIDSVSNLFLFVTYVNDLGFAVVRWEADTQKGLIDNGYRTGISFDKANAGDKILDLHVQSIDRATLMMTDTAQADTASIKLIQLDFFLEQTRYRHVSVYDNGAYVGVNAGTLYGADEGYFGGVATQLGYQNAARSTCLADTVLYKYPQLYGGTSNPSPNKFGFMQSITPADSCLPFDDTYSFWEGADYVTEAGSVESLLAEDADFEKTSESVFEYVIANKDKWLLIPFQGDQETDMLWCPDNNDSLTLSETLSDQLWYLADPFSYTFSEWTPSSGSCSDLRLSYNLVDIYVKNSGSWVTDRRYLAFDPDTLTITSIGTPRIDNQFKVEIEAVANDGRCTQASFLVTNPCVSNALTLISGGVQEFEYELGDPAIYIYPSGSVTSSVSQAKCPLTFSYYFYEASSDTWILQNTVEAPVYSFNSASGLIVIETSDTSAVGSHQIKVVLSDPYSAISQNSVEQQVIYLDIKTVCDEAQVVPGVTIANVLQYLQGLAATTVTMDATSTISACPLTYTLYFYDDANYDWVLYDAAQPQNEYAFVQSFDSTTGQLSIYSTDFEAHSDFEIRTKIEAKTIFYTAEDQFDIKIKDQCLEAVITSSMTGFSGTEANPYTWERFETQEVLFTPIQTSPVGCLTIYKVTQDNSDRTEETAVYSITDSGSDKLLQGVWTEEEVSTRFYYVIAIVQDTNQSMEVVREEVKYWVKVTNPCLQPGVITDQPIADLDYWIGDPASTASFSDFSDLVSTKYSSSFGANLCGLMQYSIFAADKFTPYNADDYPLVTDYLEYSVEGTLHTLSVETADVALYTNEWVNFYVRVLLLDYYAIYPQYAIHFQPFRVRLKNCIVGNLAHDQVTDLTYNIFTPITYVSVPAFVEEPADVDFTKSDSDTCGYPVTYAASWQNLYTVQDLPSFIVWNEAERRFEIYSETIEDVQVYRIQLTATVSSTYQSPAFQETAAFTLTMGDACLKDQISALTSIDDYIYYLNEDTEAPEFIKGALIPQNKQWMVSYDQSIDGCPVDYTIYIDGESRVEIGDFESAVISLLSPDTIDLEVPWEDQNVSLDTFEVVVRVKSSDIATYDRQSWSLSIALASIHSTADTSREAFIDFSLELRDVCWDLPLTAPALLAGNMAPLGSSQVTDLWFEALQYEDNTFGIVEMDTQWGDYCGGFTHEIIYVDGDLQEIPTSDQMASVFAISGTTVTVNSDLTWVGIHTLRIRGSNGAYESIESAEFTVEFIHPCTISSVQTVPLENMVTSVLLGVDVVQEFQLPPDSKSEQYGEKDGYTFCGNRLVYMQTVDGSTTLPDELNSLIQPYLWLLTSENTKDVDNPLQSPLTAFQLVLNAMSQEYWSENNFELVVELADWPSSTPATTTFTVSVKPCEVTSFEAPGDLEISYSIAANSTLMTIEYSFAQSPCSYAGVYSARMTEGSLANRFSLFPEFATVYSDKPVMSIYSRDTLDVGNYTIEICQELENLVLWDQLDGVYPEIQQDSEKWDPDNPPDDLLYNDCFQVFIEMQDGSPYLEEALSKSSIYKESLKPEKSAPILVVKPKDLAIYAGAELVVEYGDLFDADDDFFTMELDLGKAASFATFDRDRRRLEIAEGATSNSTAGRYELTLTLYDRTTLSTSYSFVLYVRYRPPYLLPEVASQTSVVVTADQIYPVLSSESFVDTSRREGVKTFDEFTAEIDAVVPKSNQPDGPESADLLLIGSQKNFETSQMGDFVLWFKERMIVPEDFKNLHTREVAIDPRRNRRSLRRERIETLLTDTGYVDFTIRPAMEVSIIDTDSKQERQVKFDWRIKEFEPEFLKIHLKFADPSQVSQVDSDSIVLTFWHGDLLKAQSTGEPLPNGFQLEAELPPQWVQPPGEDFSEYGQKGAIALSIVLSCGLVLSLASQASLLPVYSLFETVQLISHLPLVGTDLPKELTTFLRPVNDFVRFNFEGDAISKLRRLVGIKDEQTQLLERRFSTFGYDGSLFLPNTIQIFAVFVAYIAFSAVVLIVEFLMNRVGRSMTGQLLGKLTNGFVRLVMLSFLELVLCAWLHFSEQFRVEDNADNLTSYWIALTTAVALSLICSFATVQMCPKQATCGLACRTLFLSRNENHPRRAAMYPAGLLTRRVAFVAILLHMKEQPVQQLCLLLIISVCMQSVILKKPFESNDFVFLQFFNEFNVFLVTGLMIAFTKLSDASASDSQVAQVVTFTLMGSLSLVVAVNTLFMLHTIIFGAFHTYRVNKRTRALEAYNAAKSKTVKKLTPAGDIETSQNQFTQTTSFADNRRDMSSSMIGLNQVQLENINEGQSEEYDSEEDSYSVEEEQKLPHGVNQIDLDDSKEDDRDNGGDIKAIEGELGTQINQVKPLTSRASSVRSVDQRSSSRKGKLVADFQTLDPSAEKQDQQDPSKTPEAGFQEENKSSLPAIGKTPASMTGRNQAVVYDQVKDYKTDSGGEAGIPSHKKAQDSMNSSVALEYMKKEFGVEGDKNASSGKYNAEEKSVDSLDFSASESPQEQAQSDTFVKVDFNPVQQEALGPSDVDQSVRQSFSDLHGLMPSVRPGTSGDLQIMGIDRRKSLAESSFGVTQSYQDNASEMQKYEAILPKNAQQDKMRNTEMNFNRPRQAISALLRQKTATEIRAKMVEAKVLPEETTVPAKALIPRPKWIVNNSSVGKDRGNQVTAMQRAASRSASRKKEQDQAQNYFN